MRQEEAEKLVKEGEKLGAQGFVKTCGFEHSMAFLMQFAEAVCKTASEHKRFRMELMYDADALNTDYVFFVPEESMPDGSPQGLTLEKIDQLAEKFYDRVMEKMVTQDFATESVHEDIRIMHHLMRLKEEVGNLKTSSDTVNYDNKFTSVLDDEEKTMFINGAEENRADVIEKMAEKIYELCVENKMTFKDYKRLIYKMDVLKVDIARIHAAQLEKQKLAEI